MQNRYFDPNYANMYSQNNGCGNYWNGVPQVSPQWRSSQPPGYGVSANNMAQANPQWCPSQSPGFAVSPNNIARAIPRQCPPPQMTNQMPPQFLQQQYERYAIPQQPAACNYGATQQQQQQRLSSQQFTQNYHPIIQQQSPSQQFAQDYDPIIQQQQQQQNDFWTKFLIERRQRQEHLEKLEQEKRRLEGIFRKRALAARPPTREVPQLQQQRQLQLQGHQIQAQQEIEEREEPQVEQQGSEREVIEIHDDAEDQEKEYNHVFSDVENEPVITAQTVIETPVATAHEKPRMFKKKTPSWLKPSGSMGLQTALDPEALPNKLMAQDKYEELECRQKAHNLYARAKHFTPGDDGKKTRGKQAVGKPARIPVAPLKTISEQKKKRKQSEEASEEIESSPAQKRAKASPSNRAKASSVNESDTSLEDLPYDALAGDNDEDVLPHNDTSLPDLEDELLNMLGSNDSTAMSDTEDPLRDLFE